MSRIESGKIEIEDKSMNLLTLIDELKTIVQPSAAQKQLKGSTFVVRLRLPVCESAPEENPAQRTQKRVLTAKHILLVEDNELNREIAQTILEEAGFSVETAGDGAEAVARMEEAASDEFDLILMDVQMPRLNGYEATKRIRSMIDPHKAKIPIVAMTANAFEEDKRQALETGMNAHIAKPIEISKLMETLNGVFKG